MMLHKLPMPPSVNASLKPSKNTGRLVKTPVSIMHDKQINSYRAINWRKIDEISKFLKEWIAESKYNVIHVSRNYHFCEKRIFTKTKGSKCLLQELDTENFLKLNSDAISLLLGIDDRYFKSMSFDTIAIGNDKPEFIDVEFKIMTLRSVTS